jgi:hypothetical protein
VAWKASSTRHLKPTVLTRAADEHTRHTGPDDLAPLSCNEIQQLFLAITVRPLNDLVHRRGWTDWRRRHQARSETSHHRRQPQLKHEDHVLLLEY